MQKTRAVMAFLLGAIFAIGPGAVSDARANEDPSFQKLVAGNNAFAVDLYRQLGSAEGNLFFSPYSISTTLAMTYAGARGETETQMARGLRFTLAQDELHAALSRLRAPLNEVQKKGNVQLLIANSLWPHKAYPFRKDFLSAVEKNYSAPVTSLDYAKETEKARRTINRWVEDQTKNLIKDLIGPGVLDDSVRLVLASAIYFKGKWEKEFKKEQTRPLPFHFSALKALDRPMMQQTATLAYYADEEVQVLEMPYRGKEIALLAILPRRIDGITNVEKGLDAEKLDRWIRGMKPQSVEIRFPKLKMKSKLDLRKTLEALGMTDAFKPNPNSNCAGGASAGGGYADFSGMDGTRCLYIGFAVHQAFVELDEEGTTAAAATGIGIVTTTSVHRRQQFRADHPFLFLIRDRATGSILFMGRVADPGV